MHTETFWAVLARSRPAAGCDPVEQGQRLTVLLDDLPVEDVIGFDACFGRARRELNTWQVHGAGTVLLGRMSDEVFAGFRGWLVAQGRAVHERVLRDPDSLADLDVAHLEGVGAAEEVPAAAHTVYESRTGRPLVEDAPGRPADGPAGRAADLPGGEWFEATDDELRRRYPRLAARWLPAARSEVSP